MNHGALGLRQDAFPGAAFVAVIREDFFGKHGSLHTERPEPTMRPIEQAPEQTSEVAQVCICRHDGGGEHRLGPTNRESLTRRGYPAAWPFSVD